MNNIKEYFQITVKGKTYQVWIDSSLTTCKCTVYGITEAGEPRPELLYSIYLYYALERIERE